MNNMPKDFLNEEIRCDYLISAEMKAVWKVELDILERILEICRAHDLRVMLAAGSLLGAVRHKGMIPWDDDIDVMMPRADYNRFLEIAPKELPPFLFLRTGLSDGGMWDSIAKVSDSRTSAMEGIYANRGVITHLGIFVDIFPIDDLPKSRMGLRVRLLRARILGFIRRRTVVRRYGGWMDRIKKFLATSIFHLIGNRRWFAWRERTFVTIRNPDEEWSCMGPGMIWQDIERWKLRKEWIKSVMYVDFEYLKVPIPVGYEPLLKRSYGNWRSWVRGTAVHRNIKFDASKPYKQKMIEEYGYSEDELKNLP